MQHPLISRTARHYRARGKETIEEMEERFTIFEMMSYAKINIFKYEARKDFKGQKESDQRKITDYTRYYNFLREIPKDLWDTIAKEAYKQLGINIEYEFKI